MSPAVGVPIGPVEGSRRPARRLAFAPFGISRFLAFGALRHFAPSGIWRRSGLRRFCRPPMPIGPKPTWAPCHGLSMVDPRA